MKLTPEQERILQSSGDIKINATAGSGKTTTIIAYAKSRPVNSRILYLAFNKSVKLEAAKKFSSIGLQTVQVETAHSLAFRYVVMGSKYKVRALGYKTMDIVEILQLTGNHEKHSEYIIANHINKLVALFCNSDKLKVKEINYLETIKDETALKFVTHFHDYIVEQTRIFLDKMNRGEIEITHDFYLKKFQLISPQLNFDYILFDEGQDASAAMLDVFLKQHATKVIVGDTHQQIYSWRFAVNSLEKVHFKTYNLSTSFRFNQNIAHLAVKVLEWKDYFIPHQPVEIHGKGTSKESKARAIIARTNLGLLLKAIEYITERKAIKHVYFEGNFNSYTYADEGASLYDVLNLWKGNRKLIKDPLIKTMRNLNELEEYIEKTEDVQLAMMLEVVNEYGDRIPDILKTIKEKHVENHEKEKAEIIFSTVHRCKGMEYDSVQLVNDFISEEKIQRLIEKDDPNQDVMRLSEEINLLYVAVTRTKNSLFIPESLVPDGFPSYPNILVMKTVPEKKTEKQHKDVKVVKRDLSYSVAAKREEHHEAYAPWTREQDRKLRVMFFEGVTVKDMVKHFGRSRSAIQSRIKKLELNDA